MIIPQTVFWEITKKCNFNCAHCYLGDRKKEAIAFSREAAIHCIDWLYKDGVKTVLFMGGEPLIYPHLNDLIRMCGKYGYGIHAGVLTNGSLLTSETVRNLKVNGVSAVQISIDSISSSYKTIRGIDFDVVRKGVIKLRESKILTQAKFTINKRNLKDFNNVWRYCQQNKILLSTSLVLEIGNAKKDIIPDSKEYFSLFLKMFKIREEGRLKGKSFVLPDFSIDEYLQNGIPETGCVAGRGICGITADGKFVPCIYLSGLNAERLFGFQLPEFNAKFLETFNHHPLFKLFRKEADEGFGCPIRKRFYRGKDPFSVYEFAEWYTSKK